ncbi:hypothetical protein [Mesorhizobium sp. SP-1A]|uniref:hypothetical protein n=1 Tax=Mesorhizobium sp. SP-1A TaxID=3077840 RepID=UPI0028F6E863|nr:hypothetical protein [Mesorhizobium sp. SP-1A]
MITAEQRAEKEAFTEAFIAEVMAAIQGAYLVAIENGMTLEKAAQEMDVTPEELEDIIWGRRGLELRTVAELAFVLGFEIHLEVVPMEDVNKPLISPK